MLEGLEDLLECMPCGVLFLTHEIKPLHLPQGVEKEVSEVSVSISLYPHGGRLSLRVMEGEVVPMMEEEEDDGKQVQVLLPLTLLLLRILVLLLEFLLSVSLTL
jgi:hypothetical protein